MKLRAFALDFDGTIAESGDLDREVRDAVLEARALGIVVLLVTGRILADLASRVPDLHIFDAVVAENGAVLHFPETGRVSTLAVPPPQRFLEALRAEGIPHRAGSSIVDLDAALSARVLPLIQRLELPLVLLFNRGRLMVLPQAISKATGLVEALTALRLSPHNAIGIGDGENDHQLLATCEVGVAVEWGSAALREAADEVIPGSGPPAVAGYLRRVMRQPRIAPRGSHHRRLVLGEDADGREVSLQVRGENLLVAGETRSGKSWLAGALTEQLILQRYCVCVIDPEGDYAALEALPAVMTACELGALPRYGDLIRIFRHPDASVVLDLSSLPLDRKMDAVPSLLRMLAAIRRETGLPHRIVVDEAHYFLHEPDVGRVLDLELAGYTLVTHRVSQLDPGVLRATEAIVVTAECDPTEQRALWDMTGGDGDWEEWRSTLAGLSVEEAVLLPDPDERPARPRRFRVVPRLTAHVRHRRKYLDVPVASEHAFVFTQEGGQATPLRARTMREFHAALARAPAASIDGHLRRGDLSRWIAGVFRDHALAAEIREVERRYRLGAEPEPSACLEGLIRERYDIRSNSREGSDGDGGGDAVAGAGAADPAADDPEGAPEADRSA